MPGHAILRDKVLQEKLDNEGFVQMPFADANTVKDLLGLFDQLQAGRSDIPLDTLYTCLKNSDRDYARVMNERLREILKPLMDRTFQQYKNSSFTFQIKGLGKNSELYVHQDFSFTDERKFRSYTFWLTLMDSYPENGTLHMLKYSHKHLGNTRGGGIDPVFKDVQDLAKPMLEPLIMKAGNLVVFDCALAHYSPPNYTPNIRVSVMTNLIHEEAEFLLHFGKTSNGCIDIDVYEVPDNFFMRYNDYDKEFLSPPSFGRFAGRYSEPEHFFTPETFRGLIQKVQAE